MEVRKIILELLFHNGFLSWVDTLGQMVHEISNTSKQEKVILDYSEIKNWAFEFEALNKGRVWDGEWIEEVATFVENKLKN